MVFLYIKYLHQQSQSMHTMKIESKYSHPGTSEDQCG